MWQTDIIHQIFFFFFYIYIYKFSTWYLPSESDKDLFLHKQSQCFNKRTMCVSMDWMLKMFNAESSSLNVQNSDENIATIVTMTPEEVVAEWARENKINAGAVEKLFEEGFTSLEALKLLDEEDLSKSKIPRGQKKLILSCVRALNGGTTLGSEVEHQTGDATRVTQTNSTNEVRAQSTEHAQTSN